MKFWDSSAIVPLLVRQRASAGMRSLLRRDSSQLVWWGTRVECDSAVARMEREGYLNLQGAEEAFHRLELLAMRWHEVQPVDVLREFARRMLRLHPLRAADSLQLAAAFMAAEKRPSTLEFVCLDERLSLAAGREGFVVLPH
ncbi:MAG: type II toxin-antitoxin system VapC family toxin [Acidobacteriota bacterium]